MPPSEFVVKTVYWFFLYGCIGWGVEVVYAAIKEHKLVNRGFLCGPICPIYGFGMVGLVYSVSLIPMPSSGSMSAVAIFFIGMILTTAIELVGGWALFKVYRIRWWDYSNMKFNLGGYICPQFSLLWGLGSVLMIKVVHPLLARGSNPMPFKAMLILDIVLFIFFVADVIVSTAAAIGLNKYLPACDQRQTDHRAGHQRHDRRRDSGRAEIAAGPCQAGGPRERCRAAGRSHRPRGRTAGEADRRRPRLYRCAPSAAGFPGYEEPELRRHAGRDPRRHPAPA